jgi:calpain-15
MQGILKTVIIDDKFPCHTDPKNWALASSGPGEIWVQMLEKVWAKINGSYAMTITGLPSEALSALNEGPCISYIHKKYDEPDLWEIIKKADESKFIICTTSGGSNESKSVGLVQSHAYTLISLHELNGIKLLKIRNPWGGFEWNGDYNDKSELWTEELKKEVGLEVKNDGIFHMAYSDFLKYFPYTFIAKFIEGYFYKAIKVHQTTQHSMVGCRFRITKQTKVIIGLHQKQERFFNRIANYQPCYAKLFLCKYNNTDGTYEYILSNEGNVPKLYLDIEETLEPGFYYIFGKIVWPYFKERYCSVVISAYSDNEALSFIPLDKTIIKKEFLEDIFESFIEKKKNAFTNLPQRKDFLM